MKTKSDSLAKMFIWQLFCYVFTFMYYWKVGGMNIYVSIVATLPITIGMFFMSMAYDYLWEKRRENQYESN